MDEDVTIVVDTETTSKRSTQAQILEVAAVAYRGEQEIACFSSLVYATPYELRGAEEALRVNGLTAEMLAKAPSPAYVQALFHQFLTTFPDSRLTAFNVAYDRTVLMFNRWLGDRGDGYHEWGECIMLAAKDAMAKAGALEYNEDRGDYKWPRLAEAAALYKVADDSAAHRALADARTAGRVMLAIRKAEEAGGGGISPERGEASGPQRQEPPAPTAAANPAGLDVQVGPWTLVGHQPHPPGECGACDEARERLPAR